MKIVVAGGTHQAEYIVHMFHTRGNNLVIINPSKAEAEKLVERERVSVYIGQPWKSFVLEEARAHDADIFIALCDKDTDNYAACQLAKKSFNARKVICVVNNPNNVELYKSLGLDSVISSTYLLADSVKSESSVEDIVKAISLENNRVVMIEAVLLSRFSICGKSLAEANFPKYAAISCILRGSEVIIPNGQVVFQPKDKLMMTCAPADQKRLTLFIKQEKSEDDLQKELLSSAEKGEEVKPAESVSEETPEAEPEAPATEEKKPVKKANTKKK